MPAEGTVESYRIGAEIEGRRSTASSLISAKIWRRVTELANKMRHDVASRAPEVVVAAYSRLRLKRAGVLGTNRHQACGLAERRRWLSVKASP